MNKEQFIELVVSHILEYMPESYKEAKAEVLENTKNNDVRMHGLVIRKEVNEGVLSAPILYLDSFFDAYSRGEKDMEDVMHEIAREYDHHARTIPQFDLPDMTKEGIRDKVYLRVINTRTNQEHLKNLVSVPVDGGFSLVVYVDLDTPGKDAMIQITKGLASRMDFEERELIQTAMKNTVKVHPAVLLEMQKVMMDMAGFRKIEPGDNLLQDGRAPVENMSMLVLSNPDKVFGATALFYPEVKSQIADATGGSYYVLPSSVHEMIILPDDGKMEKRALAQMVRAVNASEVHPEEQLGNKVLYYDAAQERLTVAVDLDREKERGKER